MNVRQTKRKERTWDRCCRTPLVFSPISRTPPLVSIVQLLHDAGEGPPGTATGLDGGQRPPSFQQSTLDPHRAGAGRQRSRRAWSLGRRHWSRRTGGRASDGGWWFLLHGGGGRSGWTGSKALVDGRSRLAHWGLGHVPDVSDLFHPRLDGIVDLSHRRLIHCCLRSCLRHLHRLVCLSFWDCASKVPIIVWKVVVATCSSHTLRSYAIAAIHHVYHDRVGR